jgi:chorismate synthase
MTPSIELRDLTTLDDCRHVVRIQEAVWGRDSEIVPATVLFVSAKRGGILIGAGGSANLRGFVWSLAGRRDGQPTQWSHMLGVLPGDRRSGLAEQLKLTQRDRAVAAGIDLIEWTFDPLQAVNAHFNLRVLGAVGASYVPNLYGAMTGPLHQGTPTDRLIVEWWIREPHVERRLRARRSTDAAAALGARSAELLDAPTALRTREDGAWQRCEGVAVDLTGRRLFVPIPSRFSEMQREMPALALEWRLAVRQVMTEACAAGWRVVDFYLDRDGGGGQYLIAGPEANDRA